jgi:sigma-E factor negative regulatory protein RseC
MIMIEELAIVVSEETQGYAWIETRREGTCVQCGMNKGCGTATLARWFGTKRARLKAINPIGSKVGDSVVVGIQEQALVRGAFAVYLLPLLSLITLAILGNHMMAGSGWEEVASVLCGLFGLGTGLVWLRRFSHKISSDIRYQPIILRQSPSAKMRAEVVLTD